MTESLEVAKERLDSAVTRLKSLEEVRRLRWRCVKCGFTVHFLPKPSLYLRMDQGAPERFARALHDRIACVNSKL